MATDAGIQYEPAQGGFGAGWAAFIRGGPDWTNPLVNGNPWRPAIGNLGSVTLTYQVLRNGGVMLALSGGANFSFYSNESNNGTTPNPVFPRTAVGQITDAALTGMQVRRVVGITQAGNAGDPFDWDGSHSHDNEFSSGNIATVQWQNGNPVLNGDQLSYNWQGSWNAVDHGRTGYAPGGKDGAGNWIFDFDFAGMNIPAEGRLASDGSYRDAVVAARYNTETIHINLKAAAIVVGRAR